MCLASAGLVSKVKYCEATGKLEYGLMKDMSLKKKIKKMTLFYHLKTTTENTKQCVVDVSANAAFNTLKIKS